MPEQARRWRRVVAASLRGIVASLCVNALMVGPARAADYPAKPVKIIVPFPAGSASDLRTRKLAEELGPRLGQPIVVDNRPGAAGSIGAGILARAAPDGYTLLYATNSILSVAPHVQGPTGFDPLRSFAPIVYLVDTPLLLVVPPSVNARSVQEFIALAKRQPNKLVYGTSGIGSIQHIGIEQFAELAGVRMVHVPYKGESEVLTGLLGGQLSMGYCTLMVCQTYVKNGKLRALAITSAHRLSMVPDTPTLAESGMPGYEVQAAGGLVAPAGTPPGVIDRLYKASLDAMKTPALIAWTEANGSEIVAASPDAFMTRIKRDYEAYGKIVQRLGLRAND